MKKILPYLNPNKWTLWKIIILGILIRLIVAITFTHSDFMAITALSKSIVDTGNLIDGFTKISGVQLYGKIYYQIIALYLLLLQHIHIININTLFDVKAYKPGAVGYLQGFPTFGPAIYQIISIKLLQFLYDFLILFYLLKICSFLNLKNKRIISIFWALNPILIYAGYVMFQSDLAMVAILLGALYHIIKAVKEDKGKFISINKILALFFIAFGAIIKQVPILILPVALILFTENILGFIVCISIFSIFYFILYQPWSIDSVILKNQFLTSTESTALFNFQLNGINIFFLLYLGALSFLYSMRDKLRQNPILIIHFTALILAIVYISEDISALFPQFNLWILPFIAILALYNKNYSLFLFGPIFGFYKQILVDGTMMTGTMSTTFGDPLSKILPYNELVNRIFSIDLIIKFFSTMFSISIILLIIYIVKQIYNNSEIEFIDKVTNVLHVNLLKVIISILLLFSIVGLFEFVVSSHYTQLTNYTYGNTSEIPVTIKPIVVNIDNPKQETITAISSNFSLRQLNASDYTVVKAIDRDTNKVIMTSQTSDYIIGHGGNHTIFFSKSINEKHIKLLIYKKFGYNQITMASAIGNMLPVEQIDSPQYDNYYRQNAIKLNFSTSVIQLNIRGQYSFIDMVNNLKFHIKQKPKFFFLYGILISFLVISILPFNFITQFTQSISKLAEKRLNIHTNNTNRI